MSSDSDEENVIRYGTPLEPYEEDEVPSKRKYQQQPDQYAVDEHGRRRFHGAFTGGFSAGFGNTVGTAEGWTPSTFKSSRSVKGMFSSQRPEDFMDDEDRGEHGIAPRHMQTQNEFSGQKRTRQQRFHDGPIPGEPVLEHLVRAVHETAAVRMLRAMGWRDGQGAGGRVPRSEKRRARDQHKVYGCYMPPEMIQEAQQDDSSDSNSDGEFDYETLFAPDDYEPYILNRKNDRFGMGYSGLSRHSVLGNLMGEYGSEAGTSRSHLVMKEKGKKVSIRGQAFGVGAFEAEDEDIYATEDMSHYDFAIGGANVDKQKKKPVKNTERNVLQGFVKSTKPLPSVPSYPPPALPRDYVPLAAGARRTRFEPTTHAPRDQGLGRHELTAEARGALLGETPIPKQTEAPSEQASKEKSTEDPIAKMPRSISFASTVSTELEYIPIKNSGKDIVKVFKPFISDPKKQVRYEKYVKEKESGVWVRDDNDGATASDGDKLSEWERNREMAEFEQAAKLYRPLSGIMGDRFTHAAEPDDAVNPLKAVAKSATNYGLATPEQMAAAEKGVYGVMTRREVPWRPEALVCKRFNVPEVGGPGTEQKKEDKPKVSYSIFAYMESSVHDKNSFAKEQSKFSGSKSLDSETLKKNDQNNDSQSKKSVNMNKETIVNTNDTGFNKRMTVAELFIKESEKDISNKETGAEVTETINKFDKMDLYKAIFLSDSEEEVEDTENDVNNDASVFIDKPKNIERNTSPPRGIFANIDFDELNSWRRNVNDKIEEKSTQNTKVEGDNKVDKESDTDAVYGPKIPENLMKRLESEDTSCTKVNDIHEINSSSSDSWVDAKEVKLKKQKKKKSKKDSKKKHKKSKHKKKDR